MEQRVSASVENARGEVWGRPPGLRPTPWSACSGTRDCGPVKRLRRASTIIFLAAMPLFAHHSFATEFDASKPVKIEGIVTKIEWMNPHAWVHLESTNAQGVSERWQFEFGAPIELIRRGWSRQDLKEGDRVSIEGSMSKYKALTANARSIVLPGGKRVFSGQAPAGEK